MSYGYIQKHACCVLGSFSSLSYTFLCFCLCLMHCGLKICVLFLMGAVIFCAGILRNLKVYIRDGHYSNVNNIDCFWHTLCLSRCLAGLASTLIRYTFIWLNDGRFYVSISVFIYQIHHTQLVQVRSETTDIYYVYCRHMYI